jgi:tryptophanyl-tRNA synthetase
MSLDPWGTSLVDDYDRLCKEFGIEKIDDLLMDETLKKNRFFRRGIIFGHRDFGVIMKAIKEKKPWAVMSGIKPSGPFHLGTFTTASEIVEFQKMGGKAYYAIADIESCRTGSQECMYLAPIHAREGESASLPGFQGDHE